MSVSKLSRCCMPSKMRILASTRFCNSVCGTSDTAANTLATNKAAKPLTDAEDIKVVESSEDLQDHWKSMEKRLLMRKT